MNLIYLSNFSSTFLLTTLLPPYFLNIYATKLQSEIEYKNLRFINYIKLLCFMKQYNQFSHRILENGP